MMLAIFIFLISIIILASNIHIYIKSMNDTIKTYLKIGVFYVLIPHHKIFTNLILNNEKGIKDLSKDLARGKRFTLNILSHSIVNHIYIAKFSNSNISSHPIENGMYIILANQIRGLLFKLFRFVDTNNIKLAYDPCYENIDYYLDAHISIINLIWVSIKTIFKR